MKWKILSNGMRSFETLDKIPVPWCGTMDGNKGRFSIDAEESPLSALPREVGRDLEWG
jgi:hypothetical protein